MWRSESGSMPPRSVPDGSGGPSVAIVGLGFSGVSTAVQLLAALPAGATLELYDDAPRPARGLAYGTRCPAHLMNVRAGRLGLAPDREADFLDWLRGQPDAVDAAGFVPRMRYGDYLQQRLADAIGARPDVRVELRPARVGSIGGEVGRGYVLQAGGQASRRFDRVVLALGHAPSAPPHPDLAACSPGRYAHAPFSAPGAMDGLAGDETVLLLGSGLTAVDMLAELVDRGHRGPIRMLSRHGLLPRAQLAAAPAAPAFAWPAEAGVPTVRGLLAHWRAALRQAEADGRGWRDVVAGMRAETPALWQALPLGERRRFVRHLARYWDVHRHGCPPRSQQVVDLLRQAGRLACLEGRLLSVREHAGSLDVLWRPRGRQASRTLLADRIVNCTGASSARDLAGWPLLDGIAQAQGLLRCPLGLGIMVDEHGRLLDAFARPLAGLYYVGPLLKAQHWEAIAVPELRQHAAVVARHVASTVGLPAAA